MTVDLPSPIEAAGRPVAIRVGQQVMLTYVWGDTGSQPAAPKDLGYRVDISVGAVCAERGVGGGPVLPYANASTMNLHLIEISKAVMPGCHALLILDGAGRTIPVEV